MSYIGKKGKKFNNVNQKRINLSDKICNADNGGVILLENDYRGKSGVFPFIRVRITGLIMEEAAVQKESAGAGTVSEKGTAAEGQTAESKALAAKAKKKKTKPMMESYVVKKGDCLWSIAKLKGIYRDPFLWPVIYEANKDKIKNPNLIYPGQKLVISRSGMTMDEIKEARKKAGARKPYTPPSDACAPIS